MINTQFKLERVVYCQDHLYSADLRRVRVKAEEAKSKSLHSPSFQLPRGLPGIQLPAKDCSMEEMSYHLNAFFTVSVYYMLLLHQAFTK